MTWAYPKTFTDEKLTFTDLNLIRDDLMSLKDALANIGITASSGNQTVRSAIGGARVYTSGAPAIEASTWTEVEFGDVRFDRRDAMDDVFHQSHDFPARLTIPITLAGYYKIGASVYFATDAVGKRGIRIKRSGFVIAQKGLSAQKSGGRKLTVGTFGAATSGEWFTLEVLQSTTDDLDIKRAGLWLSLKGV